ncbi:MAG: hypothetical protein IJR93_01725, partial [Treponema sp.]|nr:hypothetical protein [Treponema sp.]
MYYSSVGILASIVLFITNRDFFLRPGRQDQDAGEKTRMHYLAIGLFGMAMVVFITLQLMATQFPFYSMGYMIGTCIIHSFVVEDEKEAYRNHLEKALE